MALTTTHYETLKADYDSVPSHLLNRVCQCRKATIGYVLNITASRQSLQGVPFSWWVCYECMKPAPLNALNSRLIRECESCEEAYFVVTWPDRMNLCEGCNG